MFFLFALASAQAQVKTNYCATEYHDIISSGDYDNPTKAIRVYADDAGFTMQLIGNLGITTEQILTCLSKEAFAFTIEVQSTNELRIEPTDLGMIETYEKLKDLILADFGVKRTIAKRK
jgi:hypothetical protein